MSWASGVYDGPSPQAINLAIQVADAGQVNDFYEELRFIFHIIRHPSNIALIEKSE